MRKAAHPLVETAAASASAQKALRMFDRLLGVTARFLILTAQERAQQQDHDGNANRRIADVKYQKRPEVAKMQVREIDHETHRWPQSPRELLHAIGGSGLFERTKVKQPPQSRDGITTSVRPTLSGPISLDMMSVITAGEIEPSEKTWTRSFNANVKLVSQASPWQETSEICND